VSVRWEDSISGGLKDILEKSRHLTDDVAVGAEIILEDSAKRVPERSGDLVGSGRVKADRGGDNAVGITYDGPYARWIHEHLHFKHPAGGEAKFLETAVITKGEAAVNKAGEHFWERL
jgi:hypothetical protein